MAQLNNSFGSGGMTSSLDSNQLIEYFQYLQRSASSTFTVKQAVMFTGMQQDGVCVLNEHLFINSDGNLIQDESENSLVWLDKDFVFDSDKIKSVDICPTIKLPLTAAPLADLVGLLETLTKHNFIPTLTILAGAMMGFHYSTIVNTFGGCPIMVAMGCAETGKSTAIKAALSVFGCHHISRFVKGTNAIFMERASRSSLPFGIEEAQNSKKGSRAKLDLTDLVIDLYDGTISANMKSGIMKPRSVPILATNFEVEDIDRYRSVNHSILIAML